jgi:hypothetical protein
MNKQELQLHHHRSRGKRVFLIATLMAAALVAPFLAPPASESSVHQVQRQQPVMNRARRATAKPIFIKVEQPVFNFDNKPDVDLRPEIGALGIAVRPGQAPRGTCSVFAMTFLLEYMYAKNYGIKSPDFSEEYLNHVSNLALGQKVDGGFFDEIDLGYQKYGIVNEALLPYKQFFDPNLGVRPETLKTGTTITPRLKPHFIKPWNVDTGLTAAQLLSILAQLKSGRPVAAGLRWPLESKFGIEKVLGVPLIKMVPPGDVFDGHSIDFVGYKASKKFPGEGYLIFRNSWGTGFGEQGYGYMSFEYATKYTNDLFQYTKP